MTFPSDIHVPLLTILVISIVYFPLMSAGVGWVTVEFGVGFKVLILVEVAMHLNVVVMISVGDSTLSIKICNRHNNQSSKYYF